MKMKHIHFLDSVFYLPMPLSKLPEAFGLSSSKSWFLHYFNSKANLDYVSPIPDIQYFVSDEMSQGEKGFLVMVCRLSDCKRVLEHYCQDDVSVLRQACRIFRRDFIEIGNIDVSRSGEIASACNKVLRNKFLKPETIGLIQSGGYTANNRYSKKALMWLLQKEQTDGFHMQHARNGREYRPPELAQYSVDGYCADSNRLRISRMLLSRL
jgi:hypothetical protein